MSNLTTELFMPVYMTTEGLADNAVLADSAQVQIGSLATVCKSDLELLYQCAIRAREIKTPDTTFGNVALAHIHSIFMCQRGWHLV